MGLMDTSSFGQTPLDADEREGLLIASITTNKELDEFEQHNIEHALQWLMGRSFTADIVFSEAFIRLVHKRMFGEVWVWAGEFRKTNKNFGVDKWEIITELRKLIDDAKFWHANAIYPPDELALRFKHRIVQIHCFPNGNGRHSRLMADIIIEKLYQMPAFTWGRKFQQKDVLIRNLYLDAIKLADNGDFSALLKFARS
jgi:Fic-DOC domain mobile mystery protein B